MGFDRQEWLQKRKRGIGASEAAAAAGVSEYSTPLEIYARKREELPEKEDTDAMRRGRMLEPLIVKEFEAATGRKVAQYPCDLVEHPEHGEVIFATPDAILSPREGLECKSTTWRMASRFGAEGTGDLPTDWLCQAQQQIACCGWDRCHFAVWVDVQTLKTYVVDRDDEAIEMLVEADLQLWARIKAGKPPDYDPSQLNLDLVRRLYREVEVEKVLVLSERGCDWWAKFRQFNEQSKAAQQEAEVAKAMALAEMGNAAYGILDTGKMIRRKLVEREPYTVTPRPYVDCREMKIPDYVARMIEEQSTVQLTQEE